jgi:hypothetical protein
MERNARRKEAYAPPTIRRIRIVAGELAVTGCKTRRARTGPTVGCFRSNCRTIGS